MEARKLCYLLVLVALARTGPAAADDAAVRAQLQAIYTEAAAALKNKDLPAVARHIAPDFWSRDVHGIKHTREEARTRMQEAMEKTDSIQQMQFTAVRVVTKGDRALVLATRKGEATIRDAEDKPRKFTTDVVALDLWIKTGEGWKLKRVEALAQRHTLDGKMLQPQKPPAGGSPSSREKAALPGGEVLDLSRGVPVAQYYSTPYNYGWGGSGYGYWYPGMNFPGQIQRSQNIFLAVNQQNWPDQKAMLQRHMMVERAEKASQRQQQAAQRQLDSQMQTYLTKQQQQDAQSK